MLTLATFRVVPWNFPFYKRMGLVEIPRETLRPELAAVVWEEADRSRDPHTRASYGVSMRTDWHSGMKFSALFLVVAPYRS